MALLQLITNKTKPLLCMRFKFIHILYDFEFLFQWYRRYPLTNHMQQYYTFFCMMRTPRTIQLTDLQLPTQCFSPSLKMYFNGLIEQLNFTIMMTGEFDMASSSSICLNSSAKYYLSLGTWETSEDVDFFFSFNLFVKNVVSFHFVAEEDAGRSRLLSSTYYTYACPPPFLKCIHHCYTSVSWAI